MGTWISPDQNTINQIDHVLINKKKRDLIEDIRTMRGPSIDSDHFLVKTILKQKLPLAYKKKPTPNTHWNKNAFTDTTKIRQYKTELHKKLIELPETQEINKEWEGVKNAIIEAANNIIKKQDKQNRNEWWDEECRRAIQEKNIARKKYMQINTRANQEYYNSKRLEANKICRIKKKEWLNNKISQIEENFKKNEVRKFYKDAKELDKWQTNMPIQCKDGDGNIIIQKEKILEIWKEYFRNLFEEDGTTADPVTIENIVDDNQEIIPKTFNEICSIINKLKKNKASDNHVN